MQIKSPCSTYSLCVPLKTVLVACACFFLHRTPCRAVASKPLNSFTVTVFMTNKKTIVVQAHTFPTGKDTLKLVLPSLPSTYAFVTDVDAGTIEGYSFASKVLYGFRSCLQWLLFLFGVLSRSHRPIPPESSQLCLFHQR